VIRADLTLVPDPSADPGEAVSAPLRRSAGTRRTSPKAPETQAFPPPAAPSWARASGRAGEGGPLFFAGAGLALLDAVLRRDPPCAGALRARLALQSAATSAKILRLNADAGALRDLRFAVGEELGPAAKLLGLWRTLADRPPALDAGRLVAAAGLLDLAPPDPNGLASSLKACAGESDPVSAAGKSAALAFSAFPDAPAGRSRDPRPLGLRPGPRDPAALAAAAAAGDEAELDGALGLGDAEDDGDVFAGDAELDERETT
jgi:hypothetical protein